MKNLDIKKFGTKLMVSSKSVNKIPTEYLKLSQNLRIYDGGIGPRKGKEIIINSTIGNNRGGFIINGKLYQITNSKIYEIDTVNKTQTERATLGYDAMTDILVYNTFAIIASNGQALKVFDGTTVTTPATVPATNSGILEYCRGYSFLTSGNILYISRPITPANPTYAYDFTGSGSQQITFEDKILALKTTLGGIYIITEKKIEFLGANSLQNVSGSAAFISTPIGDGGNPVNNLVVVASGDKIFYVTKNLDIQTINYQSGIVNAQIGDLASRPIVSISELMSTIDTTQPTAFGIFNEQESNIQFHLRTIGSPFNNIAIVYDLINDTWNIDTGKNYNYIVRKDYEYFGFSDINASIYKDGEGFSDAGLPIQTRGVSQSMNLRTVNQKLFGGFYTAGAISPITQLDFTASIDEENIFQDSVSGNAYKGGGFAGEEIGGIEIAGDYFDSNLQPFNIQADEGRIYMYGDRFGVEFSSNSQIQDWLLDTLGIRYEVSGNINIENKW